MKKIDKKIFSLAVFILILTHLDAYALARSGAPNRIVSLKPNITELLFAIDAGDQVVGVTTWCDKPEAAKKLPKVADYIKPNIEKILALRPDIVVTSEENSIKTPIKILQESGIDTILLPFKTVEDLFNSTMRLAEATGHADEGREFVLRMQREVDAFANPSVILSKANVLIIVGKRPLVAAGAGTFLGELIELAGGKNIIDGKISYPHISMEAVITRNPDVIIDLSMGSESRSALPTDPYWAQYETLDAVKNGRVHTFDIADFRIGPGLAEQVKKLSPLLCKE